MYSLKFKVCRSHSIQAYQIFKIQNMKLRSQQNSNNKLSQTATTSIGCHSARQSGVTGKRLAQPPKLTHRTQSNKYNQLQASQLNNTVSCAAISDKENSIAGKLQSNFHHYYQQPAKEQSCAGNNQQPQAEGGRQDPKESPNPTTFSNMRSQNYLSTQGTPSFNNCISAASSAAKQNNDSAQRYAAGGASSEFASSCNNSVLKVRPQIMNATIAGGLAIGSISEFKASMLNGGTIGAASGISTKVGTFAHQIEVESRQGHRVGEDLLNKQLPSIEEQIHLDDETPELKSPLQLPSTHFQNIFKSSASSGGGVAHTIQGCDSSRTLLKTGETLDKGLTVGNWATGSTLACTLQIETRNQNFQSNLLRFFTSNKLSQQQQFPFEISTSSVSPSSKAAMFHKLENKVLLTQIDDGNEYEDPDCSVPNITNTTFRQSLNSTMQINNSQIGTSSSNQARLGAGTRYNQPLQQHQPVETQTSSGVVCSCISSLDGSRTNTSCSQCLHQNYSAISGAPSQSGMHKHNQKFMINLETVLLQEVKLWTLFQQLLTKKATKPELMVLCEEWWEVTKDSPSLFDMYKIYRDPATRKTIRRAIIFECILIVIYASYLQSEEDIKPAFNTSIAKLLGVAHSNFLHLSCYVLQRMGLENCDKNIWAVSLRDIILQKLGKDTLILSEEERNALIGKNNEMLFKGIQSLQQQKGLGQNAEAHQAMFSTISGVLAEIERLHINRVKEVLIKCLNQQAIKQQQQCQQMDQSTSSLMCNEQISASSSHYPHQTTSPEDSMNDDLSLPIVIPPYLPPQAHYAPNYTLVLDLDETLIHYIESVSDSADQTPVGTFLIRPGAHEFLREMSKYYEIVIFTAAMQDYADWVLDQLYVEKCIKYRLYRQHALPNGQFYIKDLSRIGRDISRMIIVDNVAENFQLQPDNGIFIKTWIDDPTDNALEELSPLLKEIVIKQVDDVREALRIFRLQMMAQIQMGISKPKLSLDLQEVFTPPSPQQQQQYQQLVQQHHLYQSQ